MIGIDSISYIFFKKKNGLLHLVIEKFFCCFHYLAVRLRKLTFSIAESLVFSNF